MLRAIGDFRKFRNISNRKSKMQIHTCAPTHHDRALHPKLLRSAMRSLLLSAEYNLVACLGSPQHDVFTFH